MFFNELEADYPMVILRLLTIEIASTLYSCANIGQFYKQKAHIPSLFKILWALEMALTNLKQVDARYADA